MPRFYLILASILCFCCLCISSIEVQGQDIKSLIFSGDRAFDQGNYFGSSYFYEKVLEEISEHHQVRYKLAEAYRLDNFYSKAADNYLIITENHLNKYPLAEFYLAQMLKNQAQYLEAQYYFRNYYIAHKERKNYYSLKAEREILACEKALKLIYNPVGVRIIHPTSFLNTVYGDYGLDGSLNDKMYLASIRPTAPDSRLFTSSIYELDFSASESPESRPLDTFINRPGEDQANPFFDAKSGYLYFCSYNAEGKSDIYRGRRSQGGFTRKLECLPPHVNFPQANELHPSVCHIDSLTSYLLFTSDRQGGEGGYDLYFCRLDKSSTGKVRNLGRPVLKDDKFSFLTDTTSNINTPGNEVTAFYHPTDSSLYFSSDWYLGMGGYDIFKTKGDFKEWDSVQNIGYPINTPQNDLYYRIDRSDSIASLTSNREEALAVKHQSCCNDIFYYSLPEKPKTEKELHVAKVKHMTKIAKELIPITLYFDNDHPDPNTTDTVTEVKYIESYHQYISEKDRYLDAFTRGLKGKEESAAKDSIHDFFNNHVKIEFQKMQKFLILCETLLEEGQEVIITIKGYTSPLNTTEYNENLAKRRISSLINYINSYKTHTFSKYIESGQLRLQRMPFGETRVTKGISDDPNDPRNSIYNPIAAKERKIQVIAVSVTE